MAKLLIYLLAWSFAAVSCGRVVFEDCGSGYDLDEVHIVGCSRSVPCYLTVGEGTNVTAYYMASYASYSLAQSVYVKLNNVQTNTDVSPHACEATWCPVETQKKVAYSAILSLPKNIALNSRGSLRWQITNETGNTIICFDIIIETQTPAAKILRSLLKKPIDID